MDLWNDEAFRLDKTSKMIQNRVRMYLYRLFIVRLCQEYKVVKQGTSTLDILQTLKDISKSGKLRDTIMNRVVNSYAGGNLNHLESTLFPIIDLRIVLLI
jgi:hypothetical protein